MEKHKILRLEYGNIHYFSIGIIEYVIHFHAVKIH